MRIVEVVCGGEGRDTKPNNLPNHLADHLADRIAYARSPTRAAEKPLGSRGR